MARNGASTRTALMDAAEDLILETGFAATSVDRIIERAGVTKGAFFHHFESKAALGRALVERYAALDLEQLEAHMRRAETLSRDPLQQLLIFVGLLQEAWAAQPEPFPGCLFASFLSEAGLFDADTLQVIQDTMLTWRRRIGAKLQAVMATRQPRLAVDADSIADMLTVTFEGAFVVSKTMRDPMTVARQLGHVRNYLELLFADAPAT
jgi:TetR/AcrR family transcriptional repressor of nem operon